MKRSWIKLYIEILDDPKMGRLQDWLWRRAIELFLLAGENGNDGLLQPVMDLAWRLRVSETELFQGLTKLEEAGLVYRQGERWMMLSQSKLLFAKYLERREQWSLVRKVLAAVVFLRDGKVCVNCGATEDLTIDHIIAITNGGTDDLRNLQVLCRACNSSKGAN